MAASEYLRLLRDKVGSSRLLLPSVAAVLRDSSGRLLLQQKSGESWSLPAGMIEPGESPEEALVREVCEETGLQVVPIELLGVFGGRHFRYTYPNGDKVEYTVALFQCESRGFADVVRDDETVSLRYFDRESMPALALPYPLALLYGTGAGKLSMTGNAPYTNDPTIPPTEPRLASVQAELVAREMIFHRLEYDTDHQAVEAMIADEFFEVGASGRCYGRQCVIDTLLARPAWTIENDWCTSDFRCLEIATNTYLLTYELTQEGSRHTRRATIWQRADAGWKTVYHQGTLIETDR